MEFVNGKDDIPYIMEKKMFQTPTRWDSPIFLTHPFLWGLYYRSSPLKYSHSSVKFPGESTSRSLMAVMVANRSGPSAESKRYHKQTITGDLRIYPLRPHQKDHGTLHRLRTAEHLRSSRKLLASSRKTGSSMGLAGGLTSVVPSGKLT